MRIWKMLTKYGKLQPAAAFFLAAVLMMAGCQKETAQESEVPQTEKTAQIEEEIQEDITSTSHAPVVSLDYIEANSYTEEGEQILVSGSSDLPVLTVTAEKEEEKALQEALERWSQKQSDELWASVEELESTAQEQWEMEQEFSEGEVLFQGYSVSSRIEYTRADVSVLSFRKLYSEYTGGAHGLYDYSGVTFDVATGEQLAFTDLLQEGADWEAFCEQAAEYCIQAVSQQQEEGLYEDYADTIRENLGAVLEADGWYLDAAGVTVVFNPYLIGPYAMGPVFVTLPYAEFKEMWKPEYAGVTGEGSAELPVGTAADILLSEEREEEVLLTSEVVDEDMWSTRITLKVGEQEEAVEGIATVRGARVIRQDNDSVFLVFYVDMASDDYVTYVYHITDGKIQLTAETDTSYSLENSYMNPEILRLGGRINLMGTYSTEVDFQLREDGTLDQLTELYELNNDSPWALITTIRDLPVTVDGEETLLPAGSQIRITAADMEGTAWFREEKTGTEGEIHYTRGDGENREWPVYIDGVEEQEYFELLPYAG